MSDAGRSSGMVATTLLAETRPRSTSAEKSRASLRVQKHVTWNLSGQVPLNKGVSSKSCKNSIVDLARSFPGHLFCLSHQAPSKADLGGHSS
eukprot:1160741-Pelagomonas_calceolata.AAC.12